MLLENALLSLDVNPVGAWITRLQVGATNFFYPRTLVDVDGVLKFRGGCHICSPIFGKAKPDGLQFPDHGGLREKEWGSCQDTNGLYGMMDYVLDESGVALDYHVTYEVVSNNLMITTIIRNCGRSGHFDVAWHPYLSAPKGAKINMPDGYQVKVAGPRQARILPWPDSSVKIDLLGIGRVDLLSPGLDRCKEICVWTDWRSHYVCVEPLWRGAIDSNETKIIKLRLEFNSA